MINEPLVSVIIPTYNSEKYIEETLKSVLNQTYKNFEILIIDDGSSDSTNTIVEQYIKKDKRIFSYKVDRAGNPSIPRNYGIKQAKGEYIAFIDSDDLWVKNKLEVQMKHYLSNPNYAFVYSMSFTFGDVNFFSPFFEVLPLLNRAVRNKNDLLSIGNSVPCSTVLTKTSLLKKVGGFDEDINLRAEDYDLWIRLSEFGSICFIPRIQTYYRVHSSQLSSDWETKRKRLEYLAKKRNLNLPGYKFYRNRGPIILILRNAVHILNYYIVRMLDLFDGLKSK
jgi:glycosyltransferase involved in cell wall biosynthesis